MTPATVANITPRAIVNFCANRGVDTASLISAAGIEGRSIADPDARIPLPQIFKLWEESEKLTGDEMIPLHVAEGQPLGAFRVIDYLIISSSTPLDALDRLSRYFRLIVDGLELHRTKQDGQVSIELTSPNVPIGVPDQYPAYIFANVLIRFWLSTGMKWRAKEVRFTSPPPASVYELERVFRAPLRFQQAANQLIFDEQMMQSPQPHSDPALCEMLAIHAERLLQHLPAEDDIADQLKRLLKNGLERGDIGLHNSARELAVSRRSLQRRLSLLGSSYREVLDRVRYEKGVELLMQQIETDDIARRLGFSDLRAFHRAFKRWTGRSPREYMRLFN
jgi:AraC-like DNA-binding protein